MKRLTADNCTVGTIVRHRKEFLQSVSWYTNVPKDGKVVAAGDPPIVTVKWCDGQESRINVFNLELVP